MYRYHLVDARTVSHKSPKILAQTNSVPELRQLMAKFAQAHVPYVGHYTRKPVSKPW